MANEWNDLIILPTLLSQMVGHQLPIEVERIKKKYNFIGNRLGVPINCWNFKNAYDECDRFIFWYYLIMYI